MGNFLFPRQDIIRIVADLRQVVLVHGFGWRGGASCRRDCFSRFALAIFSDGSFGRFRRRSRDTVRCLFGTLDGRNFLGRTGGRSSGCFSRLRSWLGFSCGGDIGDGNRRLQRLLGVLGDLFLDFGTLRCQLCVGWHAAASTARRHRRTLAAHLLLLRRMVVLVLVLHLLVGQILLGTVDAVPVRGSEAATAASSTVHVATTAVHLAVVMVHRGTLMGVPAEHAATIGNIAESSGEFVPREVHVFLGFATVPVAGTLVGALPATSGSSATMVMGVTSRVVIVIPLLLALILVLPVGTRILVVDPAVLLLPAGRRIIPAARRSLVRFLIVRSVAVLRRTMMIAAIPAAMVIRRSSAIEGSLRRLAVAPVPLDVIASRRRIIRVVVAAVIPVSISAIAIVPSTIFPVVVATFADWRRWRRRRMPLVRTVSGASSTHDRLLLMRRIVTITRATSSAVTSSVVVPIVRVLSGKTIAGTWGVRGATAIVIVLSGRSCCGQSTSTLRRTW